MAHLKIKNNDHRGHMWKRPHLFAQWFNDVKATKFLFFVYFIVTQNNIYMWNQYYYYFNLPIIRVGWALSIINLFEKSSFYVEAISPKASSLENRYGKFLTSLNYILARKIFLKKTELYVDFHNCPKMTLVIELILAKYFGQKLK